MSVQDYPIPRHQAKNKPSARPFESASFIFAHNVAPSCLFDHIITTRGNFSSHPLTQQVPLRIMTPGFHSTFLTTPTTARGRGISQRRVYKYFTPVVRFPSIQMRVVYMLKEGFVFLKCFRGVRQIDRKTTGIYL